MRGGRDSREPTAPGDSPARVAHAGAPRLSGAAPGPTGSSGGGVSASATIPVAWGLPTSSVGDGSTAPRRLQPGSVLPQRCAGGPGAGKEHPARAVCRGALIVHAVRLNGRDLPLPAQGLDGAVRQVGALVIHDGFVGGKGTNVLELDISSKDRRDMPPVEPISAARPPLELSVEVWTQLPPAGIAGGGRSGEAGKVRNHFGKEPHPFAVPISSSPPLPTTAMSDARRRVFRDGVERSAFFRWR